jgi:PD-(D/E)XK nuclease superfamily
MPLNAIHCADPNREGEYLSIKDCLSCALSGDNGCNFTYPILKSMYDGDQSVSRGTGISVTTLKESCLRSAVLSAKLPYAEDPRDMYARWFGTGAHAMVEPHMPPGCYGEVRFWMWWGDELVSGKPDLVDREHGLIYDYKTAKELPRYGQPWPDHAIQLQLYRYLIDHAVGVGDDPNPDTWADPSDFQPPDWEVLYVTYLAKEGTVTLPVTRSEEWVKKDGTPAARKRRVPDIWTDEQVEAYVAPRMEQLVAGFELGQVPPVPIGWENLTGWKCVKFCPVKDECMAMQTGARGLEAA